MTKTILITGATDGIGFETAKLLAAQGHTLLIHGRNEAKLTDAQEHLSGIAGAGKIETYRADLTKMSEVEGLAQEVSENQAAIDVVINNAGVFAVSNPQTPQGHDVRFVVNTVAPYLLTRHLLPLMGSDSRVVNLSSAAQAPVDLQALAGKVQLDDNQAYAQSKLALTMWSFNMAQALGPDAPAIIAVNPASFLGSKMVKQAYGIAGNDLSVGADILVRAALSEEFADGSGKYFDNDIGQFSDPHQDALDSAKNEAVVKAIEAVLAELLS
ncbi:MAG: SDR family NAD(P)-dependent oxidoreductase [Pseudomonadota bacterium]